MNPYRKRFLKQLLHWGIHCSVCAAPSFLIAGLLLSFFDSLENTFAMIFGVVIFILAYSTLTTFWKPLHDPKHPLSRALKIALKIRFGISIVSLLLLYFALNISSSEKLIGWLPDYWAGWLSYMILARGIDLLGLPEFDLDSGNFITILIWTVLEGGVLSFLLFMLVFFSLLILSFRQRRKIII